MTAATPATTLHPFGLVVHAADGDDLRDIPTANLSSWTEQHRIVVLRGFPLLTTDDLVTYCEPWGEILTWDFGAVLDLVIQEDPKNYLFTRGPVPYHFDGAFARAVPRYFLFQCRQAPAEGGGGETVFCDTTQVLTAAGAEQRERWQSVKITYRTEKLAHYGGEVTWDLLGTHPTTGQPILRYAEPLPEGEFLDPLTVEVHGIPDGTQDRFLAELNEWLYNPQFCYAHQWQDGDIVIVDNHALLHGRRPFIGDASRCLQRIQVI